MGGWGLAWCPKRFVHSTIAYIYRYLRVNPLLYQSPKISFGCSSHTYIIKVTDKKGILLGNAPMFHVCLYASSVGLSPEYWKKGPGYIIYIQIYYNILTEHATDSILNNVLLSILLFPFFGNSN